MKRFFTLLGLLIAVYSVQLSTNTNWTAVDQKVMDAIQSGHFSGCVLGVFSKNATLYHKAYGTMTPTYGVNSPPVTTDMFFDSNYLTQVLGVNLKLMRMYDEQRINVTDKVSRHLFEFDNNGKRLLTLQNMMLHNSGLQATIVDGFGNTPADLLKKIDNLKLEYKEQTKFQFSELGYVVLGQLIAKKEGTTLDNALFQIMVEAGLRDTRYHPNANKYMIVPNGYNKGITQGTSGNKIANFLGVAGNAGLFTNLDNVGKFIQLMLNKGKMPLSQRVLSEEVINLFTTKVTFKGYKNTRALGWDTVPEKNPPCGSKFSQNSFGLSDPSGSYIWADKDKGIGIVLLANGGFPVTAFSQDVAQGAISDAIMTALGY